MKSRAVFLRGLVALLLAGTLHAAVPETIRGYVVVPLEARHNRFHVHAQINGKPAELLLDTGMPDTVLLVSRAQKFGTLRPEGSRGYSHISSLAIGSAELRDVPILHLEFTSRFAPMFDAHWAQQGFDGVLGWKTLLRWGAIIDAAHARLFLRTDPKVKTELGTALLAGGWTAIPVSESNQHPTAAVTLGQHTGRICIDTGATLSFFDTAFARKAGLVPLGLGRAVNTIDRSGSPVEIIRAPELAIGSYSGGPWSISTTNLRAAIDGFPASLAGVIGFDFLCLNGAVLDCEKLRLYLRKPR